MLRIAKIIFKIHRLLFKYPCKSEVRLVLEKSGDYFYNLTSTVAMLYLCGESLSEICQWTSLTEKQIKDELNDIVSSNKL
jgi:hypothetical protein